MRRQTHLVALGILILFTTLMTFPAVLHLFDGQWVTVFTRSPDIQVKLWDYWYLTEGVTESGNSMAFTTLIFYPTGTSLWYHNFNVIQVLLMAPFEPFFGLISAFNLHIILTLLLNAATAYALIVHLVEDAWAAVFGASVFAFAPWMIGRTIHPELITVWPLTLMLLAFFKMASGERPFWFAALGGIMLGVLGFVTLYLTVIATLMMAFLGTVTLADHRNRPTFIKYALLFAGIGIGLTLVRTIPLFNLADAIFSKTQPMANVDLLAFIVPNGHPLLAPPLRLHSDQYPIFYLGWVPLILTGVAVYRADDKKPFFVWGMLTALFASLSLGNTLMVANQAVEWIILPKDVLDRVLPVLLAGVPRPQEFFVGALLPFGIMAGHAAAYLKPKRPLMVVLIGLSLFELWLGPMQGAILLSDSAETFLRELTPQGEAMITLPIDRNHGKQQLYMQALHHQPIAGGMTARNNPDARAYIVQNALLRDWANMASLDCGRLDIVADAKRLQADGFELVIYPAEVDTYHPYFAYAEPLYADQFIRVYTLTDLITHPPC